MSVSLRGFRPTRPLAAMRPGMLALAGEAATGVLPDFLTSAHTRRARAYRSFSVHEVPLYEPHPRTLGFPDEDFAGEPSDRLVDAVVAVRGAERLRERIAERFAAGASHVGPLPLGPDGRNGPHLPALEALAPG